MATDIAKCLSVKSSRTRRIRLHRDKGPAEESSLAGRAGIEHYRCVSLDYIVRSTEESLRNLQVDTIDLQQLHVWDPGWIDRDEWKRAFEDLKRDGKIRFAGVSINDHQPDSALGVVAGGLIDSVQVIYNIFDQIPKNNLFPAAQKHNVGVLARVPFDEGSLTGTITANSEFEGDEFRAFYFKRRPQKAGGRARSALQADLEGVPGSLPELALRFCLSHPAVSSVIPGMRKVRNVGVELPRLRLRAIGGGLVQKLRKHAWNKNFYS